MHDVIIRLQGGLGNQMFQYAAGLALAQRLGVRLCADFADFSRDPLRDYALGGWRLHAPLTAGTRPVRRWRFRRQKQSADLYREPSYCYDDAGWERLAVPVYLDGYFQSPRYFTDIAALVRAAFQPATPLSTSSADFANTIHAETCPVAVHVRRGDYASNPHTAATHGLLDATYYNTALDIMDRLTAGAARYVVFSDDIDMALPLFAGRQVLAIRHSIPVLPHEDIVLMQTCHHHIIANSSFSWWGAWLNPRPDAWVIAPRLWFSRTTLRTQPVHDLLPMGWIQV